MPEEIPISEVRRVVIEYEIRVPAGPPPRAVPETAARPEIDRDLIDAIRRELIRTGSRNSDIFGGRA
jgi:hypothetical protein